MARIGSDIKHDASFQKNDERQRSLVEALRKKSVLSKLGGGKEAIEKHRKKGKLFARERIEKLIDPGTSFLEVGLFAAYGMYAEYGGAPSSGTIFGIGAIAQGNATATRLSLIRCSLLPVSGLMELSNHLKLVTEFHVE